MVETGVKLVGTITLIVERDGRREERVYRNVITNVGKAEVANLIGGAGTAFGFIAIGTGTTAESASDTGLVAEVARKAATFTRVTTTVSNDTARFEATFSSADGLTGMHTITETGLFNASTGGVMLARRLLSGSGVSLNWDNGDMLTIRWDIQVQ